MENLKYMSVITNFGKFIIEILEDMSKENKDCHYKFEALDIYMDR